MTHRGRHDGDPAHAGRRASALALTMRRRSPRHGDPPAVRGRACPDGAGLPDALVGLCVADPAGERRRAGADDRRRTGRDGGGERRAGRSSWRNSSSRSARGRASTPRGPAGPVLQPDLARTAADAVAGVRRRGAGRRPARGLRLPAAGRRHPARRARPLPRHAGRARPRRNSPRRWRSPTPRPCSCCTSRPTAPAASCRWTALPVVDDRAEVHQATRGRLGAGRGDPGGGAILLRARAYAEQRPITDLARDVLRRSGPIRPGGGRSVSPPGEAHRAAGADRPGEGGQSHGARAAPGGGLRRAGRHPGRGVRRRRVPAGPHRAVRGTRRHRRRRADAGRPARQPPGGGLHPRVRAAAGAASSCSARKAPAWTASPPARSSRTSTSPPPTAGGRSSPRPLATSGSRCPTRCPCGCAGR